jgi:GABA(A) receptor-associated protein
MVKKTKAPRFKDEHTFEKRKEEASRLREKYINPRRIAVIVEKHPDTKDSLPDIDKKKYLVPADLSVSQLIYVIRKRLKLPAEVGVWMYVGNESSPAAPAELVASAYERCHDKDGFLYVTYAGENAFG